MKPKGAMEAFVPQATMSQPSLARRPIPFVLYTGPRRCCLATLELGLRITPI